MVAICLESDREDNQDKQYEADELDEQHECHAQEQGSTRRRRRSTRNWSRTRYSGSDTYGAGDGGWLMVLVLLGATTSQE
jgi:hypothetical protein